MLVQLVMMLGTAVLFGYLMRRLGQPAILGELAGGILIGPSVAGLMVPEAYAFVFPTGEVDVQLKGIIYIGMLLFMFSEGLEINLNAGRRYVKSIVWTSVLGFVVPLVTGIAFVKLFLGGDSLSHVGIPGGTVMVIGTVLSVSALPVIARILEDLSLDQSDIGLVILISAALIDLTAWVTFSAILSNVEGTISAFGQAIILLKILLFLIAALFILPKCISFMGSFISRDNPWVRGRIGLTVVSVAFSAVVAEYIGIHPLFAVFVLGIGAKKAFEDTGKVIEDHVKAFSMGVLVPLYFVSIGIQCEIVRYFDLQLTLILLVAATVGKMAGAGLGALLGEMNLKKATVIGVGLNARGAVAVMLASVALDHNLIDMRIFNALVVVALLTSVGSAFGLRFADRTVEL